MVWRTQEDISLNNPLDKQEPEGENWLSSRSQDVYPDAVVKISMDEVEMEQHIEKKKNEFLDRASQLLDNISLWLRETDLKPEAGTTTIKEAHTGPYQSPVLSIFDGAGKKIASIEPVGAWVIGAEGRVDIIGSIDSESFVYMKKGGPVFFRPFMKEIK